MKNKYFAYKLKRSVRLLAEGGYPVPVLYTKGSILIYVGDKKWTTPYNFSNNIIKWTLPTDHGSKLMSPIGPLIF